jgi:RimJ/RimL family protein N-acetyltransferase
MIIEVDGNYFLSEINKNDKQYLVKYLNDFDIYKYTLNIPHPYTIKDAENWIKFVKIDKDNKGVLTHFSIRNKNLDLIGGISFHSKYGINSFKDEFGYWLAKDYWNKGIMTSIVKRFCQYGFENFSLKRLEATVFENNLASSKVLEKAGFQYEGTLRNFLKKDNNLVNVKLYSLIKN